MQRRTTRIAIAFAALATAFSALPASACQLVCFTIAYPGSPPTWDGACSAAKPGFKAALPGMVAALPSVTRDFFGNGANNGALNGLPCNALLAMMPGDPSAVSNAWNYCQNTAPSTVICCNM